MSKTTLILMVAGVISNQADTKATIKKAAFYFLELYQSAF